MVLLKGFDERGLRLLHQPGQPQGPRIGRRTAKAALLFHWKSLQPAGAAARAGRAGHATPRPTPISPRRAAAAQIGAWASKQSAPLESRLAFEKAVALYTAKYRDRRGAAAAALVGLSDRAARASNSGRTGRSACTTASSSAATGAGAHRGARRGSIRELEFASACAGSHDMPTMPHTNQPRRTLLLTGASRGIGHATVKRFSGGRLARHHLLAPSVPGELPVGGGPGGSHPGRPRRPRQHRARRSPRSSAGSTTASCTRWSTTRRSRPRPRAARGSARSTPRSTSGSTCSR